MEEIATTLIDEDRERSVLTDNMSKLKTKLDAMTKRIDKIYADRLDGLLAEDDFERLYKKLCDERQHLRDQLREAPVQIRTCESGRRYGSGVGAKVYRRGAQ